MAISIFKFLRIEIGSGMGLALMIDKKLVPGEQNLTHDVTVLAKVPPIGFDP